MYAILGGAWQAGLVITGAIAIFVLAVYFLGRSSERLPGCSPASVKTAKDIAATRYAEGHINP